MDGALRAVCGPGTPAAAAVDFHPWGTLIELKIKNTGATLARDVQFDFDEPLVTTHGADSARGSLMDLSLFKNGIPALVPGKEITLFFDQFPARIEANLPMTYKLKVSYESPFGKRYSEPTVLDLQMYVGTVGITQHGLHDIYNQLKTMTDMLKRWSDFEGLKVLTRSDIKRRNDGCVRSGIRTRQRRRPTERFQSSRRPRTRRSLLSQCSVVSPEKGLAQKNGLHPLSTPA